MNSKTTIRMNDLFIQYDAHSLSEIETRELVGLMFTELNTRATTIKFLGEQLMTLKEGNALLKQQLWSKRVS